MAFFNPYRPSYLDNPYPALARLRKEDPVFWSRELDGWVVTRYEDCAHVLREAETFASDPGRARGRLGQHIAGVRAGSPLGDSPLLGQTDPPVHTRLRSIVSRAFTPRTVEAQRGNIERTVHELLDAVPPGEAFDFIGDFAEQLPVLVIGDLLGLRDENRFEVRGWTQAVMRAVSSDRRTPAMAAEAQAATDRLRDFLTAFVEEHRDDTYRPIIGILVEAEREGDRLSPEELLAFVVFLYSAGNTPTTFLLGNGLLALMNHPDEAARLREDPERVLAAVQEMLRWDSPTHVLIRVANVATSIGRRQIRAGDAVFAVVGAANRDPEVYPDPDRFDVTRFGDGHASERRPLSFGLGPHFCLGAPLAELQAQIAFRALLERYEAIELAPRGLERHVDFLVRGPMRMRVTAR